MWPVGQVVKTAASHAVNIGSNPVRVTSDSSQMSQNRNAPSRIAQSVTLLVDYTRNHFVVLLVVSGYEKYYLTNEK